jgi:hypothetical protein
MKHSLITYPLKLRQIMNPRILMILDHQGFIKKL